VLLLGYLEDVNCFLQEMKVWENGTMGSVLNVKERKETERRVMIQDEER
jgi:hypothetical protein